MIEKKKGPWEGGGLIPRIHLPRNDSTDARTNFFRRTASPWPNSKNAKLRLRYLRRFDLFSPRTHRYYFRGVTDGLKWKCAAIAAEFRKNRRHRPRGYDSASISNGIFFTPACTAGRLLQRNFRTKFEFNERKKKPASILRGFIICLGVLTVSTRVTYYGSSDGPTGRRSSFSGPTVCSAYIRPFARPDIKFNTTDLCIREQYKATYFFFSLLFFRFPPVSFFALCTNFQGPAIRLRDTPVQ